MSDDGRAAVLRAQEAVDLAQANPAVAEQLAEAVLASPDAGGEARSMAEWALGLALRERGELEAAGARLRRAISLADTAGLPRRSAQIRSSLAVVLAWLGDPSAALAALDRAAVVLAGGDAARNRMQRGLILQRLGRLDEALGEYRLALPGLRRTGDGLAEVRLRSNRAVLHAYRGDVGAGTTDLRVARELARTLGQTMQVAACSHNLGFLWGRAGDVPSALACFDEAAAAYDEAGVRGGLRYVLETDRAEVLLGAGLSEEAHRRAGAAARALLRDGNTADGAEALLLTARSALAGGDTDAAVELAEESRVHFRRQRRRAWELLARSICLAAEAEATAEQGTLTPALAGRAGRLAAELARAGWVLEARQAALVAARAATSAGRRSQAQAHLVRVARTRRGSPAVLRLQAWHATALMRANEGDDAGARRAVQAGLRVLEQHRGSLGGADLRAHLSAHGDELRRLGLRRAVAAGDPWQVLDAVDAWRAASVQPAPVRPPADPALARSLAELRRVDAELRQAPLRGGASTGLLRQRARLETAICDRTRRARGVGHLQTPTGLRRSGLVEALDGRTLLSYFALDGALYAVTVGAGRAALVSLASMAPVASAVADCVFSLHRLAEQGASDGAVEAARRSLDRAADVLAHLLLGRLELGDAGLVIVPTGALHRLPWHALAPLVSVPVAVAPSARGWQAARTRATGLPGSRPPALVAGPGLPGARREVAALGRLHRDAVRLGPREATVDAVLAALDGADLAHIAAHGTFRADNPLFSALSLADGPLTVYDLDRLREAPRRLVLPACEIGVSESRAGDELLGLAAALLRLGSASLVAPVVPVPDEATRPLMVALHRRLLAGDEPSAALAAARCLVRGDDAASCAARAAFLVLGA